MLKSMQKTFHMLFPFLVLLSSFKVALWNCDHYLSGMFSIIFFGPPLVSEGSYKIGSVCPSVCPFAFLPFCPSICPGVFLELHYLFFLNFGIVQQSHVKLCMTELVFPVKFFFPKNWENGPKKGQKQGFFNWLENLAINFYWIWSVIKIYIMCCVPALIEYLRKFLFLRYGPKCSQPSRLQDFLINHISRINQWNAWFFTCFLKILECVWSEMGVASLVTGL